MLELVRLELWVSFLTPLIWDIGRFFFSLSFCDCGDGISTSCCLSAKARNTNHTRTHTRATVKQKHCLRVSYSSKYIHVSWRYSNVMITTYLKKYWRWIQTPGFQSGSFQTGGSALGSTFFWTAKTHTCRCRVKHHHIQHVLGHDISKHFKCCRNLIREMTWNKTDISYYHAKVSALLFHAKQDKDHNKSLDNPVPVFLYKSRFGSRWSENSRLSFSDEP